jgi:dethiobiotin synthetase
MAPFIGTEVGKTVVSAILTEALQADYWKPVQCGNLEMSDSNIVASLVNTQTSNIHAELYRFKTASSPHYAAREEGVTIEMEKFEIPKTNKRLVIEGAGGLLVPLNERFLVIDLIEHLLTPVVLVARNYMGSINHTLLSMAALKSRGIPMAGIIYNGIDFLDNEMIIQTLSVVPVLGRIDEAAELNAPFVKEQALKLRTSLQEHFEI